MGSSLSKSCGAQKNASDLQPTSKPEPRIDPALDEATAESEFGTPFRDPKARDDNLLFPLDGVDLSTVSDQELERLFFTAPKLHDFGAVTVVRLSQSLVMKGGRGVAPSESQNMIFAAESLHVPVPQVHRTFTADVAGCAGAGLEKGYFIVMDYVAGPTLHECWESLDLHQRQLAAGQVAAVINTMQSASVKLPPGPIGNTGQKFQGPFFTDYGAGPFTSLQALEDWFNHKIDVCIKFKQASKRTPRFRFRKTVLTHQDIAPRNLVLDAQEKVWFLDWGLAGMYPTGFEQAAFQQQWPRNQEFTDMVLAKLVCRQERVVEQLAAIAYGLSVAALH